MGDTQPAAAVTREIERFVRHLRVERGRSANTLAAYQRDLAGYAQFLAEAGRGDLGAVSAADIEDFSGMLMAAGRAPTSVARTLSAVRSLHRFCLDEGRLEANVAARVRPPRAPSRLPKAISITDVEALLDATGGDEPVRLRDRALLELLYATGARISEVVDLDVDDVHEIPVAGVESGGLEVVRLTGKGNKQRIVPVGQHARRALDAYLTRVRPGFAARGTGTPALFVGPRGARLSRQSAWLVIRAAAARAELTATMSPHVLRHSFATHLLAGGADVRVVQELLGHASVATTQIYTRVTADALRDVYLTAHPRAR